MKMALRCSVEKDYNILSYTQHKRFTNEDGWYLWDVSLDLSDNVVVSGYNYDGRTFIDLFCDCSNMPTLLYSKEFETGHVGNSWRLAATFEEANLIVTCLGDELGIIDTNQDKTVKFRKVDGDIACLCEKEEQIFIGLWESRQVKVYDKDLDEVKSITLEEIQDDDWPYRMTKFSDTLFVCTHQGRALALSATDGRFLLEFHSKRSREEFGASSITGDEKLNLVAVLWSSMTENEICTYSLTDNTCLFIIDIGSDVFTIAISEKSRVVTGNWESGEVLVHDMRDAITFAYFSKRLISVISRTDCKELLKFFNIKSPNSGAILKSKHPAQSLLMHLKKENVIFAKDVNSLGHAFMNLNMERPLRMVTDYQKLCLHSEFPNIYAENEELKQEKEMLREELEKAWEETEECIAQLTNLRQDFANASITSKKVIRALHKEIVNSRKLIKQLEENNAKSEEKIEVLEGEVKLRKEQMDENETNWNTKREELRKSRLCQAKETMALKEIFEKIEQDLKHISKGDLATGSVALSLSMCKQFQDSVLAAEFGRLMADVAESLNLHQVIKLAILFAFPPDELYFVRNASHKDTPGIACLDLLKKKNIINIYDVTNLQKSLELIGVEESISELVNSYQKKIHPWQNLSDRLPGGLWCEESSSENTSVRQCADDVTPAANSPSSKDVGAGETVDYTSSSRDTLGMTTSIEDENDDTTSPSNQVGMYVTNQTIGRDGGTIHLSDLTVTVPPNAFSEGDFVTLSVHHDPDVDLPCQFARKRVTPVIKLEPLNLMLMKPVRLNIPLTEEITGPDGNGVIIYTGRKVENEIVWRQEKNIVFERTGNSIQGDISYTCYLYVTVACYTPNSLHTLRAISFVHEILHVDDDIVVTVCFCNDNDAEYKCLLSDHQSNLCREEYSTFEISRDGLVHSANDLEISISSLNNNYAVISEDHVKRITFKGMLTSRIVCHQFRLRKITNHGNEEVDAKLHISQDDKTRSTIYLKKYVKDLLLSEEILDFIPPYLFAELTVSKDGGIIQIPNTGIILEIPRNALYYEKEQCLIQIRIIPHGVLDELESSLASNSSVIVELLPNNLKLREPARIVLPHCLQLRKEYGQRAKVYVSHHQNGMKPTWEQETDSRFQLNEDTCEIWLDSFCWVTCEIDNEIVQAKKIKVYTAGKILEPDDNLAEIEVGYYPDLPGEGEILRLNKDLIPAQRKPFLFVKEGSHPLLVSLESTVPDNWKDVFPDQNQKEISFAHVASSVECSHPFILQKGSDCCRGPFCVFKVSQRGKEILLTIHVKLHHSSGTCSDDLPWHLNQTPMSIEKRKVKSVEENLQSTDFALGGLQSRSALAMANIPHEMRLVPGFHDVQRSLFPLRTSGMVSMIPNYNYYPLLSTAGFPLPLPLMESQSFISYATKNLLRSYLDPRDTLGNDWKMLADKLGFKGNEIALFGTTGESPTCSVINSAIQRGTLKSLVDLRNVLKEMGREDAAGILQEE